MNTRENELRTKLSKMKRIVIKVGTSSITFSNGYMNFDKIERLCRVIANLMNQEKEVVLVTSGAIAEGMSRLRMKERPESISEQQMLATVGQCGLINIYDRLLSVYGWIPAQILITKSEVEEEHAIVNIKNIFNSLLANQVIPIVNENHTISTRELLEDGAFGDNDTLSAYVAQVIQADILILLSDIDGLYTDDPRNNKKAELITYVPELNQDIIDGAGAPGSSRGTGGMKTKIKAAMIAKENNVAMVITNGKDPENVTHILEGKQIGTLFNWNA